MLLRTSWMVGLMTTLALTTMGADDEGCEPGQSGNGQAMGADASDPAGSGWDAASPGADGVVTPPDPTDVPEDLAAGLTFVREEEKLARDVYRTLGAQWNLRVFPNISSSEQTHMARVLQRLDALGLPDPVVDDRTGAFVDPVLADLFTTLTTRGQTSLEAALQVGATIEDLDISDLEAMKERTGDVASLAVYDDLMCGSRNHLRAFVGQLASRGAGYTAQYLTQAEVDAILATPQERCGVR